MSNTDRQSTPCQPSAAEDTRLESGLLRICLFSIAVAILFLVTGCSHMNYKRIAYETLRQVDCRLNDIDQFCDRSFANEYHEYERIREDFMDNQSTNEAWLTTDPDHVAHD